MGAQATDLLTAGGGGSLVVGTTPITGGTTKHVAYEDSGNAFGEAELNFTMGRGIPT